MKHFLTALLEYLSVLLEYINLFHCFSPAPRRIISARYNFEGVPQQTQEGFSLLATSASKQYLIVFPFIYKQYCFVLGKYVIMMLAR